nr:MULTISPECIES: hypothetical protein [Snodgrassella]
MAAFKNLVFVAGLMMNGCAFGINNQTMIAVAMLNNQICLHIRQKIFYARASLLLLPV